MSEDYEDIVLSELPDDELIEQMHDDLYDGLADEITEGTQILLDRGWDAKRVLDEALVAGMTIVGVDFRDGILFVPEVLMAANAMKAGMELLRPILADTGAKPIGMMMEGAGFEVIDLGINVDADTFTAALEEHRPDILGLSALLTTTMPYMQVVIDTLKERGLRDDFTVLVGGAPLNEEFSRAIGADAYCRDAAVAVETARRFVQGAA
jgi:5-methyltetrahydrofolate--homocysteine methyltransferase